MTSPIDSRVRSSISRETFSTSMRRASSSSSLSSRAFRSKVSSSACFSSAGDVHQAGDQVGELRRAVDALQRGDHLGGHLRQQLQGLERALLERARAALDLGIDALGVVDELHAARP